MRLERIAQILNAIALLAWVFFLFALPVTNFPYFPPTVGGEALVRPLSLYPLIILLILVTLPRLLKWPLPKTLLTLLPFILFAVVSSSLALIRGIEPALGISVTARTFRGVFTLVIGVAIYLTVSLFPKNPKDLRLTLRWIYAGSTLALLWGSFQAYYILRFNPIWFGFLNNLQRYISTRHLFPERISGMTYEPNWFAEQIILLLLPWLIASTLWNYTVFPWRWRRLTIEWFLLAWASLLLPFTYSRAGILDLIILAAISILFLRPQTRKSKQTGISPSRGGFPLRSLSKLVEVSLFMALLAAPVYLVGTRSLFFARIWEYWQRPNKNATVSEYFTYLGFDARLMYSQAALNTYKAYPILGVGLGNYAFYFEDMLPNSPIANVPEVLRVITPEPGRDRLITSKNFYLRLLAETGIIGAIAFMAFMIANTGCALALRFSPDPERKFWGSASLSGLIAFTLAALTFDSFVIPNMWVLFGLITAATWVLGVAPNSPHTIKHAE